jgi:hypothetical protein
MHLSYILYWIEVVLMCNKTPFHSRQFIWPRCVACDLEKGIHQGHTIGKRAMHDARIGSGINLAMRYNLRSRLHTLIFFLGEEHTIIIKQTSQSFSHIQFGDTCPSMTLRGMFCLNCTSDKVFQHPLALVHVSFHWKNVGDK